MPQSAKDPTTPNGATAAATASATPAGSARIDTQRVTVSIVSHGQFELVQPLLRQLDACCAGSVERVVLTHNIPEPGIDDDERFGFELTRIVNSAPLGFGANHNQAFRQCRSPWFLVLNPDIRLARDVIAPLIELATPKAGLLAPRILEPGKSEPEQHRAVITPREIVSRRKPGYAIPVVPDWIPGLFMLFRSEAYRAIDGFDERFFMYGEDFDICARLQLAGWRLQIGEGLLARHEAQRASHRSRRHLYWHVSSLLKVWSSPAFWRFLAKARTAQR